MGERDGAQGADVFALARMRRTGLVAAYLTAMAPREKQTAERAARLMSNDEIAAAILARQQGRLPVRWRCDIPRAEGQWIVGPDGPLASLPGSASWEDGLLELDHAAFRLLEHLGTISDRDGRITWDGSGIPVLHAGGAGYVLSPADDGETPVGRVTGAAGGQPRP